MANKEASEMGTVLAEFRKLCKDVNTSLQIVEEAESIISEMEDSCISRERLLRKKGIIDYCNSA